MKHLLRFLLLVSLVWLVSCASIFSGNSQDLEITTNVEGVDVYLGEEYLGKTPLTTTLIKHGDQVLTLRKNGYRASKVALKKKIEPSFWWNIPFTVVGVTGMSTDYGSGAVYQISPAKFYVKMKELDFKSQKTDDGPDLELFQQVGQSELAKERARHQQGLWSQAEAQLQKLKSARTLRLHQ